MGRVPAVSGKAGCNTLELGAHSRDGHDHGGAHKGDWCGERRGKATSIGGWAGHNKPWSTRGDA